MTRFTALVARLVSISLDNTYAEDVAKRFGHAASLGSRVFGHVLLDQHLHGGVVELQTLLGGGLVVSQTVHQQREELGKDASTEIADFFVPGEVDERRNGGEDIANVGEGNNQATKRPPP